MAEEITTVTDTPEKLDAAADEIALAALPPEESRELEKELSGDQTAEGGAKPEASTAVGGGTAAPAPGNLDPNAIQCPDTLKGEIKAQWDKLPQDVREEFVRREEDFRQGYAQVQPLAELGEGFGTVISPYVGVMRQYGVNPVDHVENLLKYHAVLMFGNDQQKGEVILGLLQDANIDAQALLALGSIRPADPTGKDREIAALRAQIQNVAGRFQQEDAVKIRGELETFMNDEKNSYAWEVAPAMVPLLAKGLSLDAAYKAALAQNPKLFDLVTDQRAAAKLKQQQDAERDRLAKSRKTRGISPEGSSHVRPAAGQRETGSMDLGDILRNELAEIRARN